MVNLYKSIKSLINLGRQQKVLKHSDVCYYMTHVTRKPVLGGSLTSEHIDHLVYLFIVIGAVILSSVWSLWPTEVSWEQLRPWSDQSDAQADLSPFWLVMVQKFSHHSVHMPKISFGYNTCPSVDMIRIVNTAQLFSWDPKQDPF